MAHLKMRCNAYCLYLWLIFIVSIRNVYNQTPVNEYGYEGDTKLLICPLRPPSVNARTDWRGPPSSTPYFYNDQKNPVLQKGERLSVVNNTDTGGYNLQISSLTREEDEGRYSCSVNTVSAQEYVINLTVYIEVYNASLIPSDNPLTIREGTQREVRCVVNSDAVPAPTITWYLGSTDITRIAGTDTTSIIITGNKADSTKTLECTATNNNKPQKTTRTTLNVEFPPTVIPLSQQDILEERYLSVTCQVTPGNPSSTTFYWTKAGDPGFRQNGTTLQIPNIQRSSSGTYRCTAENSYISGGNGTHSQTMVVDVIYPPLIKPLSQQDIIEERDLSATCQVTPGNPSPYIVYWTKEGYPEFRHNGATLQISNIQRNSSGTYRCTAENNYSDGQKGAYSQSMVVNVLLKGIPIAPRNIEVLCSSKQAEVQWTSSYDGGYPQTFTVFALNGQDGTNVSYHIYDKGEIKVHFLNLTNLEPSTTYWFYVLAKTSYGSSSSKIVKCKTEKVLSETTNPLTGVIAGSIVGVSMLIVLVSAILVVIHRRYTLKCNIGFEPRESKTQKVQETIDSNNDVANYTTIKEQHNRTDRNMYEELKSNQNPEQYEAVLMKDPVDKQSVTNNAEEYANTSFTK